MRDPIAYAAYKMRLHRLVAVYIFGLAAFMLLMAWAERSGMSRLWLGPIFLFSSLMLYAGIGIYCRTTDPQEYYVAGRGIPAVYNGMAAAADWMSAASFISMAGGLYLQGFGGTEAQAGGLAYVLGWTGGFCLVALLIAPYLRKLNLYTVPDYFTLRYGGRWPRVIAALAAVLCSFTYVIAQIYGIGLIASRLTGVQFEIGILLGLGGVLLCSFLGGMRAITWTQVAQYIILLLAFLIPVSWLSYKQLGNPLAPLVYGAQLQKISEMERRLAQDPAEQQVAAIFLVHAHEYEARLPGCRGLAAARARGCQAGDPATSKSQRADSALIVKANRQLAALPKDAAAAREQWTRAMHESYERARPLGGVPPHSQPFAGDPHGTPGEQAAFNTSRLNFLALMFCLMVGTAGLPHLLTRYFTTPTVAEARSSVAWTLFFIALVYLSAPALAALVKFEVMSHLVGSSFDGLPPWIAQWAKVDPSLISVADVNGDRILQWGEIRLGADMIMLATPELGGLPYVISGLVAAGGLGGGAVHGGRLAADHQQRHRARHLLARGQPQDDGGAARHPVQVRVARGRADRGHGGIAQACRDPAAGGCLVLAGGLRFRAGDGAGHLLARRRPPRRGGRHAGRPGRHRVLHARQCAGVPRLPGPAARARACGWASSRCRPGCSACRWASRS